MGVLKISGFYPSPAENKKKTPSEWHFLLNLRAVTGFGIKDPKTTPKSLEMRQWWGVTRIEVTAYGY